MDSFEPVRASAARLHTELVASGCDASSSMILVEAAIKKLDLELVWLEPSDPVLKGARAVFDEQSGTVCCANDGDIATRATLVAHEIGHACVHAGSVRCTEKDVDASQSEETAPVGLQRVEDYGGHERRELQANVFARELLLPRSEARRRHVSERLGATAIAELLCLPQSLVNQQLLDSLLLPPPVSEEIPAARPVRPDPSQARAATHAGSALQLQAGPGTGKTRTLVSRVLNLLQQNVDPSAILVLTFSNRAAGELSERLATGAADAATQIWIGTFHAFGLDLIRRFHERLGLPADPALFDRSDAIDVLEEILPTLPLVHYRNLWDPVLVLRDIVAAISRAKDELCSSAQYRKLAQAMLDAAGDDEDVRRDAEKALEVAQVYDLYEQALKKRDAVDFGDLLMRPALLLEEDEALKAALRLRHRHVLVDEYQDVNRASARLLRAISGDGRRLWVVGDSRQSIYRFRGASSQNMAAFTDEYPNAAVDQLSINYRSSSEIVSTVVNVAPRMGASRGMLPLEFASERGNAGITPEVRRFETLEQEAAGIAASVRELEKRGVRLRDQAILCRTNARLNELAAALEEREIPILHLGSLFEREEIRDLLSLLSLAVDRFGSGLARVATMARYNVSLQDVRTAILRLRQTDEPVSTKLYQVIEEGGFSDDGARGLTRLADDLAKLSKDRWPWEYLSHYLLDVTDEIAARSQRVTVAETMQAVAIWQFLNFVRDRWVTGSGAPIRQLLDRVRQLVLLAEERDLRQVPSAALHLDAVRLMTVHGSKGLEFEAVHVPGLTVASFPSSNRGQRCPPPDGMIDGANTKEQAKREHSDEEECLFFVAISRARTHLRLYLSQKQPDGKNRSPSPYIDWIPAHEEIVSPKTLPSVLGSRATTVEVEWPREWQVTDAMLRTYEKCPRRFFYTHVLQLGGGRDQTAFTRTHSCLYKLVEWLAASRPESIPDEQSALLEFGRIWDENGPTDHAFASQYRGLAERLVKALVNLGAGRRFRQSEPLAIDFVKGRVIVRPDETAELPDGTIVLRRIQTGRKRSEEYDRLEYTLYHLAGRAKFGNNYQVEAVHLTDEQREFVTVSAKKLNTRTAKSAKMMEDIAMGSFPPVVDSFVCPRCPHFFFCAATPPGPLSLK